MTSSYLDTASVVELSPPSHSREDAEQKSWESRFEVIPGVSRVLENDFGRLHELLAPCEDADSYLTSPVYYSFTGRAGLWTYQKGSAFTFVCWHPNVPGQVIIFPQLVKSEIDIVADLLKLIPKPLGGLRLVRVKLTETAETSQMYTGHRRIEFQRCDETVLDWKYPVHVLSTDEVAGLSGHKFMKIRNHMRQLKKHHVEVSSFDPINQSRALENLLHRWVKHNAVGQEEYEHLYAPYETLFSQSLDYPTRLFGHMIFVDGQMEAVGVWDVSNSRQKTANIYVNFCNTEIRGLSEFALVHCCQTLSTQGVALLNLGGSETQSLDSYKRKFNPAISLDLCSVDATILPNLNGSLNAMYA